MARDLETKDGVLPIPGNSRGKRWYEQPTGTHMLAVGEVIRIGQRLVLAPIFDGTLEFPTEDGPLDAEALPFGPGDEIEFEFVVDGEHTWSLYTTNQMLRDARVLRTA